MKQTIKNPNNNGNISRLSIHFITIFLWCCKYFLDICLFSVSYWFSISIIFIISSFLLFQLQSLYMLPTNFYEQTIKKFCFAKIEYNTFMIYCHFFFFFHSCYECIDEQTQIYTLLIEFYYRHRLNCRSMYQGKKDSVSSNQCMSVWMIWRVCWIDR